MWDAGCFITVAGKKPVVGIYVEHDDKGQLCDMIIDEIGYGTKPGLNRVQFVGWEAVLGLLHEIGDFVRLTPMVVDTLINFELYVTVNGNSVMARRACAQQIEQQRSEFAEPLTFDLETMGFDSDKMNMLSSSFQWGDREADKFDVWKKRRGSDKTVAVQARDILESAPYSIGWNSARFDIPYLNNRLRAAGERPAFVGCHISADVVYDRKFGNKKRTSLVDAANHLKVTDEKVHKTPIDWDKWNAANAGDMGPNGMEYVLEHGDMDVILTKRVYNRVATQ